MAQETFLFYLLAVYHVGLYNCLAITDKALTRALLSYLIMKPTLTGLRAGRMIESDHTSPKKFLKLDSYQDICPALGSNK